jgi:NADH dehydrogenase [ubiquinone] 1 alpha subcomplex assembly factor 5
MTIDRKSAGPPDSSLIFDRAILARRRERAAGSAASHEFLLRRFADDLVERLSVVRRSFQTALVLGAHHGVVGRCLRQACRDAVVIEADVSPRLLAACHGLRIAADEELLPFRDGSLDLVVAPLTLHHVNDLPGSLSQIRRALKPDGLFIGAMIGGATLGELRQSFLAAEAELEGGASPRVAPFADVRDAGQLLQRAGFALPVADSDIVTVTYATPLHLMKDLRGMGATNVMLARRRTPTRRATLMRMMEVYAERFPAEGGRIAATFEIITLTGWAPHESQPKPLQPGSARARLADALGVRERGENG